MKLSQMTTEQAANALIVIAPEVQAIMQDSVIMTEIKKGGTKDKKKAVETGIDTVIRLVPVILGKHKDGIFRVLAALNCVAPEDIAAQNILSTISQVKELVDDKELLDFFTSSSPMEPVA